MLKLVTEDELILFSVKTCPGVDIRGRILIYQTAESCDARHLASRIGVEVPRAFLKNDLGHDGVDAEED